MLKIAEINSQGASFGAEDSKESETGNKGGHYLKLNLQVKVMGNKAKMHLRERTRLVIP